MSSAGDELHQVVHQTKREFQVLYWLSFGKTNWEIAKILEMSTRTVNKHLEQVIKKREVDNRTSAISMAIRLQESTSPHGFPISLVTLFNVSKRLSIVHHYKYNCGIECILAMNSVPINIGL